MGETPSPKRLRDLLVDFYLQHNPDKLQRGLDINGIVMWTGRNGIDALNEVLRNQTGHTLDLNKNLGGAKKQALRISTAFNPNKARVSNKQAEDKVLLSKIHGFYIKNDPSKLVNIHKLHKFALTNGEEALNVELRKKYGRSLPKELPNFQQQKAALQNGMVSHQGGDAAVILKNITSGPPAIQNLAINANNVGNINGKKKRRKRKGDVEEDPNTGRSMFQQQNHMSTEFVAPTGPPPAVAPKINMSDRKMPPLPPKNKPIPALPSKKPMLVQYDDDDEFTVIDDDFDEDAVKSELESFFRFHDEEQIEAIYEYIDLYAEQGRDHINQMLSNFYGENLNEFSRKTQYAPEVPVKMSFAGTGNNVHQVKGMKLSTNLNFNPQQPDQNHVSFMGHASTTMAPTTNSPRVVIDNNKWNQSAKNTSYNQPKHNFQAVETPKKAPYKTTVVPPPLPKSRKPNSQFGSGGVKTSSQMSTANKRKVGSRMSKAFGSIKKGFKNMAGNRHSLSPNAGNKKLFTPIEATPENGPCDNYRLDMVGGSFGVCVCGFSRNDHSYKARYGAPRKNVFKSTSTKFNPTNPQASSQQNLFNRFESNTEVNTARIQSQSSEFVEDFDEPEIYANKKPKPQILQTKSSLARSNYSTPYDVARKNSNTGYSSGVGFRAQYMATNRSADVVNQNTEIKKQQQVVNTQKAKACDSFRLDINGKFHGDCICGFSKFAHKQTDKFQSDKSINAYQSNLQNARNKLGTLQRNKAKNQVKRQTKNNFGTKPSFRSTYASPALTGSAKSVSKPANSGYGGYKTPKPKPSYGGYGSSGKKLGYGGYGTSFGNSTKTSHGAVPRKRPKRVVPLSEKEGHRSDPGKGKYCSKCNESFSAQFKFCGKCGSKLN